MNKTLTIVIVVLLVLAAVVYFMTGDDTAMDAMSDEEMAQMNQEQEDDTDMMGEADVDTDAVNTAPANSVVLAPAETGMSVTVQSATLSEPGYDVVYRVNSQNETQVIGSSDLLEAGDYSEVSIVLDSGIAKEQTIVAVLHADDGDGEFEFPGSDGYLGDMSQAVYTDVDIVDMDASEESAALGENVEEYLMENEADTEAELN